MQNYSVLKTFCQIRKRLNASVVSNRFAFCTSLIQTLLEHFRQKNDLLLRHFWAIPGHERRTLKKKKGSSHGLLCVTCLQNPKSFCLEHEHGRNLCKMSKIGQNYIKLYQGALVMSDPCGALNPIQYPGSTVSFQTFTFVLIDLLSPVKWQAYRVPGGQGVGLQGPRGSRGRPTGAQGSRGRPTGSHLTNNPLCLVQFTFHLY